MKTPKKGKRPYFIRAEHFVFPSIIVHIKVQGSSLREVERAALSILEHYGLPGFIPVKVKLLIL